MSGASTETEDIVIKAPKGSRYLQVLQALAMGDSPVKIARQLGIERNQVFGIQKSAKKRAAKMAANGWQDAMLQKARETIMLGMEDPAAYPLAKIAVAAEKGLGEFKVGDGDIAPAPVINNTIYQNVQILMNMKPEEKEKLLEESRRGLLDLPVEGHGALRRLGTGDEEATSRTALVVEESHSDV